MFNPKILFLITLFSISVTAQGLGDLMVAPTRVIFEDRTRAVEITLVNQGRAKTTYRASFVEMDMTENGEVQRRPKREGEIAASDLVRFAPRQVELAPGESQIIRIQVRKPASLPAGEYRSHLVFHGLPANEPVALPGVSKGEKNLNVEIKPIFGISIPVLVRHLQIDTQVTLSDLKLETLPTPTEPKGVPTLLFRLHQKGNRAAYGDLQIHFVDEKGKETLVGEAKGTAIYPNLESRRVQVVLMHNRDTQLKKGRLRLSYSYTEFKRPPVQAWLDLP